MTSPNRGRSPDRVGAESRPVLGTVPNLPPPPPADTSTSINMDLTGTGTSTNSPPNWQQILNDFNQAYQRQQQDITQLRTLYTTSQQAQVDLTARLNATLAQGLTNSVPVHATKLSAKHTDPAMFNGDSTKLRSFIKDLEVKLALNLDRHPTLVAQLLYAFSRTEGRARDQVEPYFEDALHPTLKSLKEFTNVLEGTFGDPDRKGTAQRALLNLRQRNLTFNEYATEFRRHSPYVNWDDPAQKAVMFEGLSSELKGCLITVDHADMNLNDFQRTVQGIDNRYRAAQQATRGPRSQFRNFQVPHPAVPSLTAYRPTVQATFTAAPTRVASTPAPHPDAMDLSVARGPRAPLTQAEKDRRRTNNLCMYCGGAGHFATGCPVKNAPKVNLRQATMEEVPEDSESKNA